MADKEHDPFDVSNLIGEIDNLETSSTITINEIIEILQNKNSKVVTFTGAGISTAAGIPDFRSENGLYSIVKSKVNIANPELIFDLSYFKVDPGVFYCIAKQFLEKQYQPTLTHCFIELLHKKQLLHRNFTQNVDGLDSLVGLPDSINIECHGHFKTGHCLTCEKEYSLEEMQRELADREYIKCVVASCGGLVKPDIVLFGESLPRKVFDNIGAICDADLIIIMGSSLRVAPFNQFIALARKDTPSLTINNEEPLGGCLLAPRRNVFLQSSCDEGVRKICELLQWHGELDDIYRLFHGP